MSIRSAARQQAEEQSVPSLQLIPRLQPGADGDGAALRGVALSMRAGLVALLAALAVAAAVFLVVHGSRNLAARTHAGPTASAREAVTARLARSGLAAAAAPVLRGAAAAAGALTLVSGRSTPVPHSLSSSELTALADGTSLYQPAAYLADAYRAVGNRFRVPWRLIASIQYLDGDYVNAIAGDSARAEQTVASQVQASGRDAVNAHVLAQATAAAVQPSASLVADARHLAADGASTSPAQGLAIYLRGTETSAQAVMTLAQSIAPAATGAATPAAKVSAMLNEARLLNGLPYVWGGGHTNPAWVVGSGYDCSGFVSEVLHSAGYLGSPDTTQTLPGSPGILKGPGKLVTIYDRTIATLKVWVKKRKIVTVRKAVNPATLGVHVDKGRHANSLNSVSIRLPRWVGEWKTIRIKKLVPSLDTSNNDEHVIIDIDGHWWESGGSSADGGGAMVHQIINPSKAYLKSFNRVLHPQGL